MHIVVNGANRGIGLEICRQSLDNGHRVTALCRETSEALEELTPKNKGLRVVEGVDVTKDLELRGVDGIDWLFLNAGIWRTETLEDLNFETIREQFEVNSLGPLRLFQALSGCLGAGSKVAIMTSQMGSMGDNSSGGRYGYRMSKAALNAAGVSLARDLRDREIAVALLHPGYVATDMTNHQGSTTPAQSVRGLFEVMEALTLEESGGLWNFRGECLPW